MRRVLFLYWGKRGAMVQFTLDLAREAGRVPDLDAHFSIARRNEGFGEMQRLAVPMLAVETFAGGRGALLEAWRIPSLRRSLAAYIRDHHIDGVINLMPHVWTPFVSPVIPASGARYAVIAHDADPHAGDRTALFKPIWDLDLGRADRVLTLSPSVSERLVHSGRVASQRIRTLFHPDFSYGDAGETARDPGPLRLLFLGRILAYKGLPLLVDAMASLRAAGVPFELTVMGEGDLGAAGNTLRGLGARIVNRWVRADEIAQALRQHDVMVLSHTGASQSGVIAAAFGACMPVVVTPVGGLVGQVVHAETGLVASAVTGAALATELRRLVDEPSLLDTMRAHVRAMSGDRRMSRFIAACVDAAMS